MSTEAAERLRHLRSKVIYDLHKLPFGFTFHREGGEGPKMGYRMSKLLVPH
jgi:hypothetical protein